MAKGHFFIGTSGWNYPHWRAPFYHGAPAKEFLKLYAEKFKSVEVNKSFYRLLKTPETKRWAEQTPDDFNFVLKGSRFITHMIKLKNPHRAIKRYFAPLKPLLKKIEVILFQFPPKWNLNLERFQTFVNALPKGFRYAFEFRNESWITDPILDLLRKNSMAFCIYDFDGRLTPKHVTTDFIYVRLHGPGARYHDSYSEEQLKDWAIWIQKQLRKGLDVYCYFDNDRKAFAVTNAERLSVLVGAR